MKERWFEGKIRLTTGKQFQIKTTEETRDPYRQTDRQTDRGYQLVFIHNIGFIIVLMLI